MKETERFAAYSHGFGAVLAVCAGIVLLILLTKISTAHFVLPILSYAFSMVFLFLASSIYHAKLKEDNENSLWRKIDHISIYFMIAGSYTPLVYFYLINPLKIIVIVAQWSLVLIGIILKFWTLQTPRWLTAFIYLAQGWMVVIFLERLIIIMPTLDFILLVLGGVSYSIGAILYTIDSKPNKVCKLSFHDIFHILVIIGAAFHWVVVYHALKNVM